MTAPSVQLGFCIPIENEEHLIEVGHRSVDCRLWDGGQVGGVPIWLDPEHIPAPLFCRDCSDHNSNDSAAASSSLSPAPLRFICQIYAPVDYEDSDRAFHRSLYVFACPSCPTVRVLRSQLPADNPYFPLQGDDIPEEVNWRNHLPESWNQQHLCALCGCLAKGRCPRQNKYFCGPFHQREFHMLTTTTQDKLRSSSIDWLSVYPMTQLVVEEEPELLVPRKGATSEVDDDRDSDDDTNDGDINSPSLPTMPDVSNETAEDDSDADLEQEDLNQMTGAKKDSINQDPVTMKFYQRLTERPNVREQCLRYSRWTSVEPLWIRQDKQPSVIPHCPYCQSKRKFEFQIMPQMLHYLLCDRIRKTSKSASSISDYDKIKEALQYTDLVVQTNPPDHIPPALIESRDKVIDRVKTRLSGGFQDEIDWGIIAVYTCESSCGNISDDPILGSYREEFAWVQPSLGM